MGSVGAAFYVADQALTGLDAHGEDALDEVAADRPGVQPQVAGSREGQSIVQEEVVRPIETRVRVAAGRIEVAEARPGSRSQAWRMAASSVHIAVRRSNAARSTNASSGCMNCRLPLM